MELKIDGGNDSYFGFEMLKEKNAHMNMVLRLFLNLPELIEVCKKHEENDKCKGMLSILFV